ncbi:flagellar M-ring protein FliF [Thermanaerovibrio acidaminovorans DSM 6589]|uniref:Flagellar M-ring protein n=1 Tax=Thermanaerovibrio acidaminovorans (strain ATCC 49978 / DSM 6589 / Su883) TaxID=525903 RepID=D1B6C7_THEAS|nr:flagellar basal-body MS-ring/collar protein FliF [Thermanaerovibrio acidaminovorans]ACZ19568.1 flagellar M-ring protein FliF [Thermanaerovibrio acidaminovorans DSM 6589]
MDRLKEQLERLKGFFLGLERWQRYSLVGAGALVLASLVLLAFVAGRTAYDPLFSGLTMEDQGAVVEYLKEQKIPFKVDPGANAILVPRRNVYEARIALAQMGIPKGGVVGFEIFDQPKMGMNDFQQRVAYARALEGELSRTISKIDAVEEARVSIVIPEQRLFLEEQRPSTASVLVRLKPGREIGQEQVRGIVNLVARSVEGLRPEDVTVVDTSGKVLSDLIHDDNLIYMSGSDGRAVSSVQRELERQQEQELERKVRVMLEKVFGPGKAVVRVRVELDFDKKSTSRREFIPGPDGKGVIRSQQNVEESYTGPGTPPGGAPGTTTNIPGYVVNPNQGGNVEYNKTDTVTNYDITTQESQTQSTPGAIKRLSASVIVDGQLDEAASQNLRQTVAAAIGIDEARGDRLVIQAMKFDTTLADQMLAQLEAERRQRLIGAALVGLLVLLAAGGFGFLWYRRRKLAALARLVPQEGEQKAPSLKELLENPELMTAQGELAILEEQLRLYASNNPEEVANLIKNWLAEES